jgi:hypothetical protein
MTTSDKKVIASLYLKGHALDPAEVTQALRVRPTASHTRGELHQTSSGREFVTKTGLWSLVVDRDQAEVSDVLEALLAFLGKQSVLVNLPGVQEAYFDVFVAYSSDEDGEGTCAMDISPAQLNALSHYGLPVRFTVSMGRP